MQRRAVMVIIWMLGLVLRIDAQSHWSELPPIPDKEGYAGMFAGVSHDVLICAGGANFPDKKPWEGGIKQWYDNIYLLKGETEQWAISGQKLPWNRAYGVTVSYQDRVILIGGSDATGHYADVLSLENKNGEIIMDSLPALPEPLANMCGVVIDGVIYIAGGNHTPEGLAEKKLYLLNLRASGEELRWLEGPSWPGPARIQSVAAAHNGMFYLFSGFDLRRKADGTIERMLLQDAYRYQPDKDDFQSGQWQQLPDLPRGAAAAPSPAFTLGMDHIVIPGGLDTGTLKYTDPVNHPGFIPDVIAFNVKSNEWVSQPDMPSGACRVTAPAAFWKGHWVIPNGEMGPGRRSPKVFALDTSISFGWQNWLTLMVYLFCMLLIGFYFSRKENTTADYFLAGGRIPWWAAGISIYGTQLSAITFMAIPAIVYATDWRLAVGTLMILGIVP
jgi:solute:Na+ symporter, SSS family